MKFMSKTQGAISIFLVIILLPMLTIGGVILDVSRVKLAEETVVSSADLALNTVLSKYDKNLKDYFGLLASCQDTDDVIEISKQYFEDCMVSAGISTSETGDYIDNVFDAFVGDDDIQDMLQLSVDGEVSITRTANGAMDNPALLKKGIVEFMKYRAPVNAVADIFQEIADSEVTEQVENTSKETKMIEAKKEFYEAEKKLIEQTEIAYEAIKKYEKSKVVEEEYLNQMSLFLANPNGDNKSFEEIFKDAHEKMIMNLYNTHNVSGSSVVDVLRQSSIPVQNPVTTFSENSKASPAKIQKRLNQFNSAIVSYIQARTKMQSDWEAIGSMKNSDYPIQYWVLFSKQCAASYNNYVSCASSLWSECNKLENAVAFAEDEAMNSEMGIPSNSYVTFESTTGKLPVQSIYNTLINYYNTSLDSEVTGGGCRVYRTINEQIRRLDTAENNNKLRTDSIGYIFNIRNKLNDYYITFEEATKLAKEVKDEVNKLKNLLDKYKKTFDAWKTAANDSELEDSALAASNKEEIGKLEAAGVQYFSKESVEEVVKRFDNIYTLCKTFQENLKNIKYKNTPVKDISGYSKFRSAASVDARKVVREEASLRQYVEESFSFSIGTQIQRIEIRKYDTGLPFDDGDAYVVSKDYHPKFNGDDYELYRWMKTKFDGPIQGRPTTADVTGYDVNDKKSAKKASSSITDLSEDTTDVQTEENIKGNNISAFGGATLPSQGENAYEKQDITAKISEVSKFASDIFSNFSGTFKNSLVNTRDDLFMIDYIRNMFTYDTFENEGCYSLLSSDKQNTLKANEAQSAYSGVKSQWKNSDEIKTLTLTPRDTRNNWAYGGEIEYILYGNGADKDNKATAYAQIYMIRYALDLSAVFNEYWDDPAINLIATALQTYAFIPIGFTKTVVCLAITAAEAAMDVNTLKMGIPVVLLKSADDLFCDYSSVFLDEDITQKSLDGKITLQYSDYMYVFLFIKLLGNDENVIYLRTGDVIQINTAHATSNKGYSLAKAQVYYDIQADVIIEPMWSRLLAIDDVGDLSTSKGWRSISMNLTRGY